MKPKIAAIVEARMSSSRLPGKHMLEANGRPILEHLINRLKSISLIDDVIIATTKNNCDDVLCDFAEKNNIKFFRGDEYDVMGRVLDTARHHHVDIICEVTGDCVIIDPQLLEQLIDTFLINDCDYINSGKSTLPDGMGAQVFTTKALNLSASMTENNLDREHVTLHIKRNPNLFKSIYLAAHKDNQSEGLGLVLDEIADYKLLKKIIEYFGDDDHLFTCKQVLDLLNKHKDWLKINNTIVRKGDT